MTIRQLLADLSVAFHQFEDPKLEARQLVLEALRMDLNEMILRGDEIVPPGGRDKIELWRVERMKGVPLAYLAGHKAFYKADFIVRPGVLIPRPETELIVETALTRVPGAKDLADFGCGTGCIGLSLLGERPGARLSAIDRSAIACEVTRQNALQLRLLERTEVVNTSVEEWGGSGNDRIAPRELDLIVANPPYISLNDERVQPSVHDFEPHEALYAADEGLAAIRSWMMHAFGHLRRTGLLVMEIGSGQSVVVQGIMKATGYAGIQIARDLNGIERVVSGIKPE